jgi:signal transduction histidine kinase
MRAPTRAITGFADRLLDRHGDSLAEDARLLAARIAVAGRDLEATLEGLAGLTRLAGHELRLGRVDLAQLAREAWNDLAPGDATHASRLVVDCEGAPAVRADRALARTLLRNLLGNALKFSRGRPDAPVTFAWVSGPPPHFLVRDQGVGFDLAAARQLFEPFGRQHPASQFEGAGIGLAIVRRVAERHGGRVWAESRPGEGATFRFSLPAA